VPLENLGRDATNRRFAARIVARSAKSASCDSRRKTVGDRNDADNSIAQSNNLAIAQTSFSLEMFMKKLAIAIGALALVALIAIDTHAQAVTNAPTAASATNANDAKCATLDVTGLKSGEGTLMIAVYASAETFFKKSVWATMQRVTGASMQVSVCDLNAEEIAITAFQDMNGNQKLDSNPIGIPTEPYAASGTPSMFGAPTWKDTKVAYKSATAPIPVKF
jgi:uncharacterized protein (DUF2141 family)